MTARPRPPDELERATLERCTKQDPLAFRAFVVRYERPVFAVLSRILGPGAPVEDLAQETFLRAFRAFPSFDVGARGRPSTWLLTIAVRLAVDEKRKRRGTVDIEDHLVDASTPHTQLTERELGRAIEAAVEALGTEQRACFVLVHFHARSLQEVAQILDVPEATVKTRLFRAREKLKFALLEWRDEEVS